MQKRLDRMEKMDKPITERRKMGLDLRGYRGSNKVLELDSVQKAFGAHIVFDGLNEIIWHGERVGLIGPNGAGKSVLIRMVLGEELPDVGEIKLGPSVTVGYGIATGSTAIGTRTRSRASRSWWGCTTIRLGGDAICC